jgi:formylglycine-generating enzyme required for sulfatase activity
MTPSIHCSCRAAGVLLGLFFLVVSARGQESKPASGMSLIPAGDFWMGRTFFFLPDAIGYFERDRQDDFPAHKVYLDAFFMDQHEVTNEEYARFLADKRGTKPWHWPGGEIPKGEEKYPVYNVDWYQAEGYCVWDGKRLPSEAEWEKAARGGLDRNRYAWGNAYQGSEAGVAAAGQRRPAGKAPANTGSKGPVEVGKFPANGYGLFDMIGNVWEWTSDWYQRNYYSISPLKNPHGPEQGAVKVFRGAGWIDVDERNLMPSFRNYADPLERAPTIGFRCAQSAN